MSDSKLKPKFELAKLAALTALGVILGVGTMVIYKHSQLGVRRSVASVQSYKPSRLILGKQAAAMSIEIVGPETNAESADEITELVGYVTQNTNSDTWMDYKWTLPAGVELVQGQITGSFESLPLGQPTPVTILVKGFSRDNQKLIALSTQFEKAGSPLSASAVIVSRPEDTSEARMMDLAAHAKAEQPQ